MAIVNLYMAVQRLNVGDNNWDTLIAAMQSKGRANNDSSPRNRNHWRPSIDGTMWIFEAKFESSNIDINWFINWLANEFSVNPAEIGETTGYNQYGRFSTIDHNSLNRIRIGIFGFVQGQGWPSWSDSHQGAVQYIADNNAEWNTITII